MIFLILSTLRCLLALVLAAWSSLIFFRAQKIFLFQLTVGATEYGHWFVAICLLLAVGSAQKSLLEKGGSLLLVLAAVLFCIPLIQASRFARDVPTRVDEAFPSTVPSATALSFPKLWSGTHVFPVAPQTHVFATHAEQSLHLYFYPARRSTPAPCIIVLHTGGWSTGSPVEFLKMNSWLAAQGYAVAAVEYRLAPRWTWPAQRDDVLDAMRYLTANSEKLGIDPTRFVLFGRSAGGQIAEAVAYGQPNPAIRGCISFYAPADLYFAYKYARADDILSSINLVINYMAGTPQTAPANYDSASGILLVTPQAPPTLMIHGLRDEMVWMRQNQRLSPVLTRNGVRHLYLEFPWATHAFDFNFDGPGGQISRYAVERFLASVTK